MKNDRHNKIIELIKNNDIETQEQLAKYLNDSGYNVTQATVSRDIRQLKLTKTFIDGKTSKYVLYENASKQINTHSSILKDGFISMEVACNLLVVKTAPGMAMALCATIDSFLFDEMVGSIAGDDTIMIATRSANDAQKLLDKISEEIK